MKRVIILIILIAAMQNVAGIGIGVSPSDILLENSLKGASYERSITIFNMGDEEGNYSLSTSGDIEGWASFYSGETKINDTTVPPKREVTVIVRFEIPSDAFNKNYTGSLIVKSIPKTSTASGSQQSLIVGGSVEVTIMVIGDQILDGIVKGISTEDVEQGYPLKIQTFFSNTGNVVAIPEIDVTIIQNENKIDNFKHDKTKIRPANTEFVIAEWNTTYSNIPGNYSANVTVSLNGKEFESKNLLFKILPPGTLTRKGELTNLSIEGETAIDKLMKVNALFANTGDIDTPAKFKGEVFKDGELVDTIESEELTTQKLRSSVLSSYLKLSSAGNYLIKGKVIFSGKETPVKEYSFKIPKSIPGFNAMYVVLVILIFSIINRRNRGELR